MSDPRFADEPADDAFGRRSIDRYPGPEAVGVMLVQMARDLAEIKVDLKEGFRDVGDTIGQHDTRLGALERFRERVEERDRALAKSEGNLTVRLPVIALGLTLLTIAVIVGVAVLPHG